MPVDSVLRGLPKRAAVVESGEVRAGPLRIVAARQTKTLWSVAFNSSFASPVQADSLVIAILGNDDNNNNLAAPT